MEVAKFFSPYFDINRICSNIKFFYIGRNVKHITFKRFKIVS